MQIFVVSGGSPTMLGMSDNKRLGIRSWNVAQYHQEDTSRRLMSIAQKRSPVKRNIQMLIQWSVVRQNGQL